MTNEEAIVIIRHLWCSEHIDYPDEEVREALDIAKKAIEKQISKKPNIEHYKDYDTYSCPKCNRRFICKDEIGFFAGERSEFCDKCGKAIDWSDEK